MAPCKLSYHHHHHHHHHYYYYYYYYRFNIATYRVFFAVLQRCMNYAIWYRITVPVPYNTGTAAIIGILPITGLDRMQFKAFH